MLAPTLDLGFTLDNDRNLARMAPLGIARVSIYYRSAEPNTTLMPNIRSAAKRMRQNTKRRAHNRTQRAEVRTVTKHTARAIAEGQAEAAKSLLPATLRSIGKAAQKRLIHKNKAARQTSRLTKQVNALQNKDKV